MDVDGAFEEELSSFAIAPVKAPVCSRALLGFAFGIGNEAVTFEYDHPNSTGTSYTGEVALVRWDTLLDAGRRLVAESATEFVRYRAALCAAEERGESQRIHLVLSTSKALRSLLQVCIYSISAELAGTGESEMEGEDGSEAAIALDVLRLCDTVWGLCESLFFAVGTKAVLNDSLAEWLRNHLDEILPDSCQTDEERWPIILHAACVGRLQECIDLLAQTEEAVAAEREGVENSAFRIFSACVDARPHRSAEGDFAQWRSDVAQVRAQGTENANPFMDELYAILLGEDDALRQSCSSWYELFVARCFHAPNVVCCDDLPTLAEQSVNDCGGWDGVSAMEQILLAILSGNIVKGIRYCMVSLGNWWFCAHLVDLLKESGALSRLPDEDIAVQLHEKCLLEYAQSLCASRDLWPVVMRYGSAAGEAGRAFVASYLNHIPVQTDREALKLVAAARREGFADVATSVCRVRGMQLLRARQHAAAVTWLVRAGDSKRLAALSQTLLRDYALHGKTDDLAQIARALGPEFTVSGDLAFVSRLRAVHEAVGAAAAANEQQERVSLRQDAVRAMVDLVLSGITPYRWVIRVLVDHVDLLDDADLSLSTDEVYGLLDRVTYVETLVGSGEVEGVSPSDVAMVHLALSRGLARAVVSHA